MCVGAQRQFTAMTLTARPARQFAVAMITSALPAAVTDVADDCELVIGEFVANAINADAKLIDVSVQLHHDRIELAVTDDAHGWPVLYPRDVTAPTGRGLQIVAALATTWGVTVAEDRRTTVWAHLACDQMDTTHMTCRYR
jgi:serine/threonine-protein kinase RsbW